MQLSRSGGGVPKLPIVEADVTELGIVGDAQNDTKNHGGPERALCLFAIEVIEALAAEGHAMAAGATGENITTRGLDWELVIPGARLRLGSEVLIEVTRYTTPCYKNARWFMEGDFNRCTRTSFPAQAASTHGCSGAAISARVTRSRSFSQVGSTRPKMASPLREFGRRPAAVAVRSHDLHPTDSFRCQVVSPQPPQQDTVFEAAHGGGAG